MDPQALQTMTDALAHRGPDGQGVHIDGSLGLGHRRLAIIDPSPAGHQPMQSADGRYVLSYNGEVYNFRELRAELEALGSRFRSSSDTEVVLYALAQWGTGCTAALQRHVRARALGQRTAASLLLARDRYGIKPLYYTLAGTRCCSARRSRRSSRTRPTGRALDRGRCCRVLHLPEPFHATGPSSRAFRCCQPARYLRVEAGSAYRLPRALLGLRLRRARDRRSRGGVSRGARPPLPPGGRPPARRRRSRRLLPQRRHRLRVDHRDSQLGADRPS